MTKKLLLTGIAILISSMIFAQGVMSYVPSNSNLVVFFQNNGSNYDALKNNVPIFSFLLSDLGLESLVQSSVSNTANSLGLKSSQIWQATLNDFVIFGNENQKNVAIVVKADSTTLGKFFQSLLGGTLGSENVSGNKFQTFSMNSMKLYFYGDSGYTLISNSPSLISEALNAKAGSSFKFTQTFPSSAWFEMYWNGQLPMTSQSSTNLIVQKSGYAYGQVNNGALTVYGKVLLDYNDSSLKAQIIASKPDSLSLATSPATGDLWVALDVANPSAFYDVLKPYLKESIKDQITKDFVSHFSGKAFADMGALSDNGDFVATMYLNKDLSSYIPTLSKESSATLNWNGHTVLRDDTVEGTKTVSMYTIFYPDKVVFSNMLPDQAFKYIESSSKANAIGNYSTFSSQLWSDSFMTGYFNTGALVENMLQYSVNSGAILQTRFDNNGNVEIQFILK